MSETVLEVAGLSKRYKRIQALQALDLEVHERSVFGLLGPNGSGKSTTLGILLGAIHRDGGSYSWFGQGEAHHLRKRIGAILETPCFYHYLDAESNLRVVARIKECSEEAIPAVLERVGLSNRRKDAFKTYSLGMKQRLAIASALLGDPSVLVLDEPTNGLDPQGIAEIRELIVELAAEGRTIVLASHLLDEVQKVCSDFAVLKQGKKIYQGSVAELNEHEDVYIVNSNDREGLKSLLSEWSFVKQVKEREDELYVQVTEAMGAAEFNKKCMDKGQALTKLIRQSGSLEKRFLEILRQGQ